MTTTCQTTGAREIWGFNVEPKVGRYVQPDGWRFGSRLILGDCFSTFRLPCHNGVIESIAVEVELTGKTLQRKYEMRMVRVRITVPGDGCDDSVFGGWMEVPW